MDHGKTYLLRIINAALHKALFFAIAKHKMTVVGTDGSYTKPLTRDYITIFPGQTYDVLLEANQRPDHYYMTGYYTPSSPPSSPDLPAYNDTKASVQVMAGLRSLADAEHPCNGPMGRDSPQLSSSGTEVRVLEYNSTVEIILQGTAVLAKTHHPMHLHGYSFYVVGWGFGNFDGNRDPLRYNLVDPPLQNTIFVPSNGWVAIRFKASNPGVWFMHCHIERHLTWGMETAFIVKNGKHPEAQMLPPPSDMPPC
ncbi:Laccase-14 [Vitis vinifera]|uniref:Laccase-14 n=1 Tax=Vitis vinifera TaxID=29760 RepID=A0A438EBV9_VITVI|nr:Laccase-14 [Vitis vinifera]